MGAARGDESNVYFVIHEENAIARNPATRRKMEEFLARGDRDGLLDYLQDLFRVSSNKSQ